MLLVYLLLSIITGVTVVIGRIINANLAEKIGTFQGTLINFIVGLSFSFLFLFISNESIAVFSENYKLIPSWAYFGGLIGVVVVILSNYITPRISAFYSTLLMFIGQLFFGIVIDYIMLHEMSIGKIIGGLFVLIGLGYNLWLDKKQKPELK
ncbi:MAG: DMT family transporter [Mobilitalea sp.]